MCGLVKQVMGFIGGITELKGLAFICGPKASTLTFSFVLSEIFNCNVPRLRMLHTFSTTWAESWGHVLPFARPISMFTGDQYGTPAIGQVYRVGDVRKTAPSVSCVGTRAA